jgi:23S rRNA pseudouridine1911/1915/1917 synthase
MMIFKTVKKWHFPPLDIDRKRLQEAAINLFDELPSRKSVKKGILAGDIFVNSKKANTSTWVEIGDEISLKIDKIPVGKIALNDQVIYDDAHMCITLKKAGLVTSGNINHTLELNLLKELNINASDKSKVDFGAAHRLDKDTHGLVIFYKSKSTAKRLGEMFKKHEIDKEYFALVHGNVGIKKFEIKTTISKKNAHTIFEKISTSDLPYIGAVSLLKAKPITGRKHQIRIHCKSIGHQIVGDKLYTGDVIYKGHGMFLACSKLEFNHPITGEPFSISTPLPRKFRKLAIKF